MKESNLVEFKINKNFKREKKSPIRTLLKLTVNSKNKKNISIEKRMVQPSLNNNNILNKVSSARNVNQNYCNLNIQKNKKLNDVCNNNNENINYNSNSNLLLNKINKFKNNNQIKENKNITVNCIKSYNNYGKKKNEQNINKIKNIKHKQLKIEQNNFDFKQTNTNIYDNNKNQINKNIYTKKNNEKNNNINNNININNNNININNNNITNNISFFNSRLQISNKKEERELNFWKKDKKINIKKKNIIDKSNNINNTNNSNNTYRNSSCINFYNKKLKNNFTKNTNNSNFNNDIINNNIKITKNNNLVNEIKPYTTLTNDELYSNRLKLINKKINSNHNQNQNINDKNENITTINNIIINSQKDSNNNIIYSPKKGIYRMHSQENVKSKRKEGSTPVKENNKIYKNKSVKDLTHFTYSKKKCLSKKRISNAYTKKYGIIDISDCSPLKNDDSKIENNLNKKILTVMNKEDADYLNDLINEKYQIKPDIYPEIKINLKKNKHKKIKNNSVIVENRKNINNISDNEESIIEKNISKKICSLYNKYKENNKLPNNKKEIYNKNSLSKSIVNSKTYLSNITNITITDSNINNYLNNIDIIKNKNIKTNINNNDRIISINDLYYILIFEEKIKNIFNSLLIHKNNFISNYCFEIINFFFNYSINKYIQNIIYDKIDIKNLNICNNYTLFAIILFYDLSFNNNNFMNLFLLIKEILKLIYSNLIIIIRQSYNVFTNLQIQEKKNVSELYDIINNILNKYINNKELFFNDNEYILLNKNTYLSCEEKIYTNLNFIIRNIHTIVNNIQNTQNYNHILNLLNIINNISLEDIKIFFRTKILRINMFNSSLLSSTILDNNISNNRNRKILPYITKINKKKYTLILSLDDTIIHFKTNTFVNNKGVVQIRPGLIEFLQNIKNYYEIIIFSSGNQKYSDAIIDSIDEKNKYIDYRLYQEHCIIINDDFVKDLSKIGRPIDKTIIIDNIPQNYRLQNENGINIKSFYGDNSNDRVLFYLSKILINFTQNEGDIRKIIKKYWNDIVFKVCSNIYNNYCK